MTERFVNNFGSDGASGTKQNPWRTETYAQDAAKPGDKIWLMAGHSFNPINAYKSDIVWDVYGGSEKPKISGFLRLTAWTSIGNGLYETTHASLQNTVRVLRINGKETAKGRWPKATAPNGGYLTISSAAPGTVSNSAIATAPDFMGESEVVIRSLNYTFDRLPVTGKSGSTITYSGKVTGNGPYNGFGFYIQNHRSFLTEFGDWMYNPSSKKITMFFGTQQPGSYTIECSAKERLITTLNSPKNVSFNNISLTGSNDHAVFLNNGNGFKMNGMEISYAGMDGVNIINHQGCEIDQDCWIHHINNNGVFGLNGTEYTKVQNSRIENVGLITGFGKNGLESGYGVQIPRASSLLYNCDIKNIGYIGVRFEKKDTKVIGNRISYGCLNRGDGGLVYNWNGGGAPDKQSGLEVRDNILHHTGPSHLGTPYGEAFQDDIIYIDDHGSGVLISGNTCYGANGRGIYLHNAETINVYGNLVFDCKTQMLVSSDTVGADTERIVDLIAQNNTLIAKKANQTVIHLASNQDDIRHFINDYTDKVSGAISELPKNRWDNNIYGRPLKENIEIIREQIKGATTWYTVDGWKQVYGWDQTSKSSPLTFTVEEDNFRLETNETQAPVTLTLDKTYRLPDGSPAGGSIVVQPNKSVLLLKESDVNPNSTTPVTVMPPSVKLLTPMDKKAVIHPSTVQLTVEVTPGDNPIQKVEYRSNGSVIGTVTAAPWSFDWVNPTAGIKDIQAVVTDTSGLTGESNFSALTVYKFLDTDGVFRLFLNVGTANTEEFNGQSYTGELYIYEGPSQVDNVQPDTTVKIFQTGRAYNILHYPIPVPNGRWTLKTYHNEPWFGVHDGLPAGPGKRVFDILAQGVVVKANFDIYVESNNQNTILTFEDIEVTDGILDLRLVASVNNANISAIEIIPYSAPVVNQAPVAVASADVISGTVPLVVSFAGDQSTDDIGIVSYLWDFGDGFTSAEKNPVHIYNTAGAYTARLTVTDGGGLTGTADVSVTAEAPVSVPPTVKITYPMDFLVTRSEQLNVSLDARDENGTISRVLLYLNDQLVDQMTAAPFESVLTLLPGSYILKAIAYDNDGLFTESEEVEFTYIHESDENPYIQVKRRFVIV